MVNIEKVVRVVTPEQKPKGRSHGKSTAQQAQQVQRPRGALFPLSVAQQRNYVPSRMTGMAAAVCGAEGRHIGIRTWVQLPQQLDGRAGPVGDDRGSGLHPLGCTRKRIRLPLGYKGRVIWIQRGGCTVWRCGLGSSSPSVILCL